MSANTPSHPLMLPPPGYKFIPNSDRVCGKPGCFECFSIYCVRCESKDRRIVELELRNNELVKHITLLQGQLFPRAGGGATSAPVNQLTKRTGPPAASPQRWTQAHWAGDDAGARVNRWVLQAGMIAMLMAPPPGGGGGSDNMFAYVQSPVLHDPNLNMNYVATTTFSPVGNARSPPN